MALRDILKGLAEIENEVDGIRKAYDRVPESLKDLPCILNIPSSGDFNVDFGGNVRHLINATIIVDRAELPQSQNKLLDLIEPVKDKIDDNGTLHGNCHSCIVIGYSDYGVHEFGGVSYFGVTLQIDAVE